LRAQLGVQLHQSPSEMTYIVSSGALNSTHSLTHSPYEYSSQQSLFRNGCFYHAKRTVLKSPTSIDRLFSDAWS